MTTAIVVLILIVALLMNAAGFAMHLFTSVPLYDELAHTLMPFAITALTVIAVYRADEDSPVFRSSTRAALVGGALALLGALAWEGLEVVADRYLGLSVYHPPLDTVTDVLLGALGGALGAWVARHYVAG